MSKKILETSVENALHTYNSMHDNRFHHYESFPEWWTIPIKKGTMGYMSVKVSCIRDGSADIDVYIDTSDEKNNIMYLRGIYRSQLDR